MAITRCPYCHAIIDEADKYCNNCGTQLLFSEDEEVEEEIPGEKIIDAEVEEKDYTVEEPEGEKKAGRAKDLDEEIDEDLKEGPAGEPGKTPIEELMTGEGLDDEDHLTEEVIVVDEIEASGPVGEKERGEGKGTEPAREEEELEPEDEEAEEEELAEELEEEAEAAPRAAEPPVSGPDEADVEELAAPEVPDETATAGEASLRPATFDTQELENLGQTVELSREKIDKFIEVMAGTQAQPAVTPAAPALGPTPGSTPEPPTGTLPPWASTMKGAPVFPEETGPVEARKIRGEPAAPETGETEIFPRRRGSDSTIGLPEKVAQAPLPFGRPETETEEEEEQGEERAEEAAFEEGQEAAEEELETPAPAGAEAARPSREPILPVGGPGEGRLGRAEILPMDEAEAEQAEPRPPFSFSVFFKSKAFDLLFVGLFWLVALWLAASSMGSTLFDILGAMSGAMLLLYAVFMLLYFFLFKFFLGETLGDRLFRPRE